MADDLFDMLDEAEKEAAANVNTQDPAIQPTTDNPATPSASPEVPPQGGPLDSREFNLLDAVSEVGKAAAGGVEGAVRETVSTGAEIVNAGARLVGAEGDVVSGDMGDPLIPQPETTAGKIAKDVVKFGLGFVGGSGILRAVGLGKKLPGVIKEITASGIGTGIVADPHEARLSNIIQEYPYLENDVNEFLAAKPGDSKAEGKFKAALEDMLTTPVAMVMFKSVMALKKLKGKGPETSQTELDSIADDLMKDIEKASDETPGEKFAHRIKEGAEDVIEVPEIKVTPDDIKPTMKLDSNWMQRHVSIPGNKTFVAHDDPGFNKHATVQTEKVVKEENGIRYVLEDTKAKLETSAWTKMEDGKMWMRVGRITFDKDGDKVVPSNIAVTPEFQRKGIATELANIAKGSRGEGVDFTKVHKNEVTADGAAFLNKFNASPSTGSGAKIAELRGEEVIAKSSTGEPLFTLTKEQKDAVLANIEGNITKERFDHIFDPAKTAFNYTKMNSTVEVKRTLEAMADMLSPALDKNVGQKQTFKQIEDLAQMIGDKPEQLVANLHTWGVGADKMAATVVAAKNWMQSLSSDIFGLSRSIYLGTGGNSAKVEMLRLMDILADVEGMTKSIQKAAARTTAAGRIRTKATYSGKDLKQMIDAYGGPEALDKVAERIALADGDAAATLKVLQASGFRKFVDSHNELWINGILSSPKTHIVNIISTASNTLAQPLNMIAGGIVRREWGDVKEGLAVYRGLRQMIGDSWEMARRAFKTENPILGGNKPVEHQNKSISAQNYNLDPNSWLGWGVDGLGKVTRFPGRFLGAEDEFFKQMNYRAKLMAQASREAWDQVKNGKLDPKKMVETPEGNISEVEKYIQDRFRGGFDYQAVSVPDASKVKLRNGESVVDKGTVMRQTFGTDENALRYAEEATFTQDLKTETWFGNRSFSETLQTAANTHPLLRGLVLPFIRVPANLTRQVFDYTPIVGQLHKRFWADIAAGGTRKSVAIGKLSLGSTMWTGAMFMAMEGRVTGRAPGDKELRERKMESGWQPYSFVFGEEGNRTYVSFARFDPIGMVFGLAADFAQMANQVDENQRHSMATAMTLALAENLSSKSYLKGLVEISSMLGSGYAKEEIAQRIINMRVASYIPNWVNAFRPDDELKAVRTAMDAVMAKIPGLSETVEARRDYFGEKKEYPMEYPWSAINPFSVSEEKADPVRKELARLATSDVQAQFTLPREKLGTLDLVTYKNSQGQTAYDRWLQLTGEVKIGGRTFHEKLSDVINSEKYKNANDGTSVYHMGKRPELIKVEQERYRSAALKAMLNEFHSEHQSGKLPFDLQEMVRQDQANERRVKRNKTPLEILKDFSQ